MSAIINLSPLDQEKREVFYKILQYFDHHRMGYIKVPTGWGKTFLAKHLMKNFYDDGKVILYLVSRNNPLLIQTFFIDEKTPLFPNSLILFSNSPGITPYDLERKIKCRKGGIAIFASLQTILSKKKKELGKILSETVDFVVIDEIHNFILNKGNQFIEEINQDAKILGLTATPFQGVVGKVKFVEDISEEMREIFSKTLPQCILDGQLSELTYTIIQSNLSILDIFEIDERKGLSELMKEELYLDCSDIDKINLIVQRTYLAKKIYEEKIKNKSAKTLVFCAPVRNIFVNYRGKEEKVNAFHAKLSAAVFNGEVKDRFNPSISFNNYTNNGKFKHAVYLSSDLPKKEREKILKAFKTWGEPPFVLCTVGMLIEGFDFPELENLILLRPTLSLRLFEQQVGRVTRLSPLKEKGHIFEIVDDPDPLYDKFGEQVFNEGKIERVQMLHPEHRLEELFTEGNNTQAITQRKIQISQIDFNFTKGKFHFWEKCVDIPSIPFRMKYFLKMLSITQQKKEGKLHQDEEKLLRLALGFKINNLEDAKKISELTRHLEQLAQEAQKDPTLSRNCKSRKPQVFRNVKWFLTLKVLTHLKHFAQNLSLKEKEEILKLFGFKGK